MDDLPLWSDTNYPSAELVNLQAMRDIPGIPEAASLRSYATGRRSHALHGPMPAAVCRVGNRRLWMYADIIRWLTCPIPPWRRSKHAIDAWAEQGRPRP